MGQKLSSKLLFIYSPNSDGFYIVHISHGSVAMQLRCGGRFSNHLLQIFHRMHQWKILRIGQYFTNIWTEICGLLFGPPCIWAMSAEGRGMRRGSAMSSLVGVTINNLFHRPIGPISHVTSWNSVSMFTLDFIYFRWHLHILWCYFSICISFFTVLSNFYVLLLGPQYTLFMHAKVAWSQQ